MQPVITRPPVPVPERMRHLPVDPVKNLPIPWFVAWIDGKPEWRVADGDKRRQAMLHRLCWVCGEKLGSKEIFLLGPMCAVNRISAEPPCHLACAEYSVRACPFLSRPNMERREGGLPEGHDCAGIMIARNPGVTILWHTKRHYLVGDGAGGVLLRVGDPFALSCWAEGRKATVEEVRHSFDTGVPALQKIAEDQGEHAVAALGKVLAEGRRLLGI